MVGTNMLAIAVRASDGVFFESKFWLGDPTSVQSYAAPLVAKMLERDRRSVISRWLAALAQARRQVRSNCRKPALARLLVRSQALKPRRHWGKRRSTRASRDCLLSRRSKYYWAGLCLKNDPTCAKGDGVCGAAGSTCVSRSPSSMPTIAISSFSSTATGWPAGTSFT